MYFAIFYPNVAESYWLLSTNSASRFDCLECPPGPGTWAGRARPHSSCSPCLHACFGKNKGCSSANVKRGKRWDQSTWTCWIMSFSSQNNLPNLWGFLSNRNSSLFEHPNLTVTPAPRHGRSTSSWRFFRGKYVEILPLPAVMFFFQYELERGKKGEKHPNEYGYND